ncbi:hypothetical protein [Candidatus Albibeggiatoa sp. nov. BB20]|uniref:hypothetical protein n=1 Tax=Candidatus Albibeggiatoa sp. nov. BB20 TaxID=3162723 RepID=UPI003365A0E3
MKAEFFILSVTLNVPIFFLLRHFITSNTISADFMNAVLGIMIFFIVAEHIQLYFSASNGRNLNKLNQKLSDASYVNRMAFLYLFYGTLALASVIYYPNFPSVFALFIIIFVFYYFVLSAVITAFVYFLTEVGFRYNLQDSEKVKQFLKQLSSKHEQSEQENENCGENRLSMIEINAIDDVFKKMIRKELKIELKFILYSTLLLWSRLFSLVNATILSLLLAEIV